LDLSNRAVIVTGSSSGIGEAIARSLAGLGAEIVVNSATSARAGQRIAAELPDAVYVQGDVGDPATATALVEAARERWGRLDGLVNNAGVTIDVPMENIDAVTPEHSDKVLTTNVVGTFLVSQAALPLLRAAGDGWIVNITSVAGVRQTGSSLPYAVSKVALNHLTAIMAKHAGGGVRVNAVAPGLVATPWTQHWHERKAGVELIAPLHRVATPTSAAHFARWLAVPTAWAAAQFDALGDAIEPVELDGETCWVSADDRPVSGGSPGRALAAAVLRRVRGRRPTAPVGLSGERRSGRLGHTKINSARTSSII
jgi:ketoreductase RED2